MVKRCSGSVEYIGAVTFRIWEEALLRSTLYQLYYVITISKPTTSALLNSTLSTNLYNIAS